MTAHVRGHLLAKKDCFAGFGWHVLLSSVQVGHASLLLSRLCQAAIYNGFFCHTDNFLETWNFLVAECQNAWVALRQATRQCVLISGMAFFGAHIFAIKIATIGFLAMDMRSRFEGGA